MGNAACAQKTPIVQSRTIDRALAREKDNEKTTLKLLLLGTGECGKSTFLKQVRILHDKPFDAEEKEKQKQRVYSNIYVGMNDLCQAVLAEFDGPSALAHRQPLEDPSWCTLKSAAHAINGIVKEKKDGEPITHEQKSMLKKLWKDTRIRAVYEKRNEFQISDSIGYFLDNLDRICAADYSLSNEDYLNLRTATTGVVEHRFEIKDTSFRFIDVGGQRSERKKWISQFEDVSAIIFLSAINEYDQMLFEDNTTNRLKESMKLFDTMVNSGWFKNTTIILFLNKTDIFREKIKKKSISCLFENFQGPDTFEDSSRYIESKFDTLARATKKKGTSFFSHFTCATDTNQVSFIFETVIEGIIQQNLYLSVNVDTDPATSGMNRVW